MMTTYNKDKELFFALLDDWYSEYGLSGIFKAISEWLAQL